MEMTMDTKARPGTPAASATPTAPATNRLGLTKSDYAGKPSTLCKGCGHDSVTAAIIQAFYESSVSPYEIIKVSGIGCSSKTPTYFLDRSHGFNSVHGRMPSVATGAAVVHHGLRVIGVSGDGDTASIGLGQFCHLVRRNVRMVYVIENNGTYGLTKGQFSATADLGSKAKRGAENPFPAIDCAALAIELGATFVARSFSGDRKQLIQLLKAAHAHRGLAVLDVVSPCVTFNNHPGSTKSYTFAKAHDVPLHELGFVEPKAEIAIEADEGTVTEVPLHDGSILTLKKLHRDWDPRDKSRVLAELECARERQELLTGLLYFRPNVPTLDDTLELVETPLVQLDEAMLDPGPGPLEAFNESHR
jgi:2-oxoglutarate ferredoxin oxidoreductase subunit beta